MTIESESLQRIVSESATQGVEEVVIFPVPTLESIVLERAGVSNINEIKGYGKIIIKNAIIADVVASDLPIEERNVLMTYRLWARGNVPADELVKFSGFSKDEMQRVIDSFLWETQYDQYYDRADEVEELIPAKQKLDTYRVVAEKVNDLLSEGAELDEIKYSIEQFLQIESKNKARNRVSRQKLGSFSSRLLEAGISDEQITICIQIAKNKKAGIGNAVIAERLGIRLTEVNNLSRIMIAAGLVEPHRNGLAQSNKFRALAEQVAKEEAGIDESESVPTESELASRLGVSGTSIKRARAFNSARGINPSKPRRFSKKPSYEKHRNWRKNVKEGVLLGLTNEQISYEHGIPKNAVKYHRANLIDDGELVAHRSPKGENKKKLIEIVDAYLIEHPGESLNLSQLLRSGLFRISYSTLQSMYAEIAKERAVPPLKRPIRREKE